MDGTMSYVLFLQCPSRKADPAEDNPPAPPIFNLKHATNQINMSMTSLDPSMFLLLLLH
jgi:hypothetical protein